MFLNFTNNFLYEAISVVKKKIYIRKFFFKKLNLLSNVIIFNKLKA